MYSDRLIIVVFHSTNARIVAEPKLTLGFNTGLLAHQMPITRFEA
jgi:hypothetical protein